MSADTWEQCPVCHNRPEDCPEGIDNLYGKIPLEEFLAKKKTLDALEKQYVVRGDYGVSLNDDRTVSVDLCFVCTNCGATWEYEKDGIQRNERASEPDQTEPDTATDDKKEVIKK